MLQKLLAQFGLLGLRLRRGLSRSFGIGFRGRFLLRRHLLCLRGLLRRLRCGRLRLALLLGGERRRFFRLLLLSESGGTGCFCFGLFACRLCLLELRFEFRFLGVRGLLLGQSLARFRRLALRFLPLFVEPLDGDGSRVLRGLHCFARGHVHALARRLVLLRVLRLLEKLLRLLKARRRVFVGARRLRDLHGIARLVKTQRNARIHARRLHCPS